MTHQDHWNHALNQMALNGTLVDYEGQFYPSDSVSATEIEESLIRRFSTELNEDLWEEYGRARSEARDSFPVIEEYLSLYAKEIDSLLSKWSLFHSSVTVLKSSLREKLDGRYEY